MFLNYYETFENINKQIIAISIRVTNTSDDDKTISAYLANSNDEKIAYILKDIELSPDETFVDSYKTIVPIGQKLVLDGVGVDFVVGVQENDV
jgi:hypothetical protein